MVADLTTMADHDLADLHSRVVAEVTRRDTIARAPARIADFTCEAINAGASPDTIRDTVEQAIAEQTTA